MAISPFRSRGAQIAACVVMAAGIETLTQLSQPGFYETLECKSDAFIACLEEIIAGKGLRPCISQVSS
jgi:glutamate-1-semialdehyde aminotransferase